MFQTTPPSRENLIDDQSIQPTFPVDQERELRSYIARITRFLQRADTTCGIDLERSFSSFTLSSPPPQTELPCRDEKFPDGSHTNSGINGNEERLGNLLLSPRSFDFIQLLPMELRILIYDMLVYTEHTIYITPFRRHRTAITSLSQTCSYYHFELAWYTGELQRMERLVKSPVFGWLCPERTIFVVPPRGWKYVPSTPEWTHKAAIFKATSGYPSPPKRTERARLFLPSHPCHSLIAFEAWQDAMNSTGDFVEEMFNDVLRYHPCFGYYRRMMDKLEKLEWD